MTSSTSEPTAVGLPRVAVEGAGTVQTVDYQPGSTFGPRRLEDYEFVWLLAGSAEWTVTRDGEGGPRQVRLEPGLLLLARPGAVDSYQWDAERVSRHAWAHFRIEDRAGLPEDGLWPELRLLHRLPVLAALGDYLLELGASAAPGARARSDQVLALLLDLFVRGPLEQPPPELSGHLAAALDTVRRCWREEGLRIVEVDELARGSGLSAGHLFRLFRQRYGCGPAHALELVRLARAAVMLQRSNATLAEVAAACGFANAYHLSRRFRAAYGLPPGGYRRSAATADPLAPVRAAGLLPVARALEAV